jgi:hypothetical protein
MKRGSFMDERGFWKELSMKRGIFVDERGFWKELSMKRGIFVDERGFWKGVNFSGSHLTKEIILILWNDGQFGLLM